MATRQKSTFEERVQEYVDSPMMTQRMRHEKCISAQIRGNCGVYRTTVDLKGEESDGRMHVSFGVVAVQARPCPARDVGQEPGQLFQFGRLARRFAEGTERESG